MHAYYDNMRHGAGVNGPDLEMPQSLFDECTIIVDGNVNAAESTRPRCPSSSKKSSADGAVITKTRRWCATGTRWEAAESRTPR